MVVVCFQGADVVNKLLLDFAVGQATALRKEKFYELFKSNVLTFLEL